MKRPIFACYMVLIVFIILSFARQNMEFVVYSLILIPLIYILHKTDDIFSYKETALWGVLVWMLLHMAGGFASFRGTRLYDYILIDVLGEPYNVLKYDQFLHFFCYVIVAMLLCSVFLSVMKKGASPTTIFVLTVLAAVGIGALNEIIEFIPVVAFNSPGPGGYTNTVIDIIGNTVGAIVGVHFFRKVK